MANFNQAIPRILAYEGGYVNDPDDPGGETNRGIIDRLDGKTDRLIDVDGDGYGDISVKGLTEGQAKVIYKRQFWDKMYGDKIQSQAIAEILFDGMVNTGRVAIKQIQRLVGAVDDGIMGPDTLRRINQADEVKLYNNFKFMREVFYNDLAHRKPVLRKFLKGWMNRLNSFKDL